MTTSLDRKLARCAREIEEAKPKVMSYAEFEKGVFVYFRDANGAAQYVHAADCRQIKGAAQTKGPAKTAAANGATVATPVAAPPSTEKPPKFKVGDRVASKKYAEAWPNLVVEKFFPDGTVLCTSTNGYRGGFDISDLELIPSEPKEADGWIPHKGSHCPIPIGAKYRYQWYGEGDYPLGSAYNLADETDEWHGITAYRLVKQQ